MKNRRRTFYHHVLCALAIAAFAPAATPQSTTNDQKEITHTLPTPIDQARQQLKEYERTKSTNDLESAIRTLYQVASLHVGKISEQFPTNKEQARMWLELLAAIERNQDPKFDPNDPQCRVSRSFNPRPDRDSAANEKAWEEHKKKSKWAYLQIKLRNVEREIASRLDLLVLNRYKARPEDQTELDQLLRESGVSASRQEKVKEIVEGIRKPGQP
jgi:type III secretory pathway component EscV